MLSVELENAAETKARRPYVYMPVAGENVIYPLWIPENLLLKTELAPQDIEIKKVYGNDAEIDPELLSIMETGVISPIGRYALCRPAPQEYTRNLHLLDLTIGEPTEVVISGFGFGEVSTEKGKIQLSYSPPDKSRNLKQYCLAHNLTVNGSFTYNERLEKVQQPSTDPLGGYGQKSVQAKIDANQRVEESLRLPEQGRLRTELRIPELVAKFKNASTGTYGMVYRRPYMLTTQEIEEVSIHHRSPELFLDFFTREFGVLRLLHEAGISHCQLHGTNKGMTLQPERPIFIGDWEELLNLNKFDNTRKCKNDIFDSSIDFSARQIINYALLSEAIVRDLRQAYTAITKGLVIDFFDVSSAIIKGYARDFRGQQKIVEVCSDYIPAIDEIMSLDSKAAFEKLKPLGLRLSLALTSTCHYRES